LIDKLVSSSENGDEQFKQIKQNIRKLCKEIHERSITLIIKEPE
jgi:peptidoglycan hydrolase CwlO-like protein